MFGVEEAGCFVFRLAVKIDLLPDPNNLQYGSAAVAERLRERREPLTRSCRSGSSGSSPLLATLLGDKCNGLEEKRMLLELSAG